MPSLKKRIEDLEKENKELKSKFIKFEEKLGALFFINKELLRIIEDIIGINLYPSPKKTFLETFTKKEKLGGPFNKY